MEQTKQREAERIAKSGKPKDKSTPTKREVVAAFGQSWEALATIGMVMSMLPFNDSDDRS